MEETDKCAVGKWDTRFTYKMKPRGKWVPMTGSLKNKKKKEIEKLASEFGVHVFEAQKWAQDEGVSFKVIGY